MSSNEEGGDMSVFKPKLSPWYGFGIFFTQSPSVADPAAIYGYILMIQFWHWSTSFRFGGR